MYEEWYAYYVKRSSGNRRKRLEEGHGHAEKKFAQQVWYPAFRNFEHLHPEYEVADFQDGSRFLDFAYIRYPLMLAIEIDGYGPHSARATRWQFADSLMRQNHLIIDGWRILRFSYDDIEEKPRMCIQLLQQFMGSWFDKDAESKALIDVVEKEILRYSLSLGRELQPRDVRNLLKVSDEKAYSLLRSMMNKGLLLPHGKGTRRIRSYQVNPIYLERRKLI